MADARPHKVRLFTPGPVEIPPRVLRALSQPPPHHRTENFRATLARVTEKLKALHGTAGEVFILPASGTGAMEAAVVNVMSPRRRGLAIAGGKFGERWASLLKTYGVPHTTLDIEWGASVEVAKVEEALTRDPSIDTVFATHSETSTGALHDVQALARMTRARGVRLVVDAITSLAVHPLAQDAWGVDVIVCGSQKGLMTPPGLSFCAVNDRAQHVHKTAGMRTPYWDWTEREGAEHYRKYGGTAPIHLLFALRQAIDMIHEEGLPNTFLRHRLLAEAVRRAVATWAEGQVLGFNIAEAGERSDTVTTVVMASSHDPVALQRYCKEKCGLVLGVGIGELTGQAFRIAHMGHVNAPMILGTLGVIEVALHALGIPHGRGGVEASIDWLGETVTA